MHIRIEAHALPGRTFVDYQNVHVAVQRRGKSDDLLGLTPGDAESATWTLDCTATPSGGGVDVKGQYVQGPPGGRFIYLSWGTVSGTGTFTMFRRAKLMFDAIPTEVLHAAVEQGVLLASLPLIDRQNGPLCAAVRPPTISWAAAPR